MSGTPTQPTAPSAARLLADSPAEPAFDRFTSLVSELFNVPVSLISVVEDTRQVFKSLYGLTAEPYATQRETPLSHSFCQHVVAQGEPLIVPDAREHPLVRENLAIRDLHVISYAGAPIFDEEGNAIAALCAIDSKPRAWSPAEISTLRMLAEQVTNEVAMQQQLVRMGVDLKNLRAREATRRLMNRADRHDMRTPLNALLLNLQALEIFGELNADQEDAVRGAERSARELLEMVNRYLETTDGDAAAGLALLRQPVSAGGLVLLARAQIASLAREKGLQLEVPAVEPGLMVNVDEGKFLRVLMNLLSNAVKYTPTGGQVWLHAELRAESIAFVVRDSGIGIALEYHTRIFEEGFRVDAAQPTRVSAGVGLAFCRAVVEAHGGQLTVESAPGAGSTFTAEVPRG